MYTPTPTPRPVHVPPELGAARGRARASRRAKGGSCGQPEIAVERRASCAFAFAPARPVWRGGACRMSRGKRTPQTASPAAVEVSTRDAVTLAARVIGDAAVPWWGPAWVPNAPPNASHSLSHTPSTPSTQHPATQQPSVTTHAPPSAPCCCCRRRSRRMCCCFLLLLLLLESRCAGIIAPLTGARNISTIRPRRRARRTAPRPAHPCVQRPRLLLAASTTTTTTIIITITLTLTLAHAALLHTRRALSIHTLRRPPPPPLTHCCRAYFGCGCS